MIFFERFAAWTPQVLSLLRITSGLLLLQYGTAKILGFPDVTYFNQVKLLSLTGVAGTLELVGGILILLGIFTRPVAFILSGEMAFAYFLGHAPKAFIPLVNNGNLAILFCFAFFYLTFAGGGPWSLDSGLRNKA